MKKQLSKTYLPNNQEVFCLAKGEAEILYHQVREYTTKHSIVFNEDDIVFDVGANIGLFSLMANDLSAGKAKIYAFEPIPKIFEVLQSNAMKFAPSKIKAFNIGLGNCSQTTNFSYYPNATAISSLHPDRSGEEKRLFATTIKENIHKLFPPINLIGYLPEPLKSFFVGRMVDIAYWEKKVKCELKTISEIIAEQSIQRIDLLKIDVEKAELDVLEGIDKPDWSKIQQIVMEVHNLDDRVEKVVNLLKSKGFVQVHQEQDPVFKHLDIHSIYAKR